MIQYRTPTVVDAAMLAALGRDSFVEAFGALYQADDLAAFLEDAYSETRLAASLANPQRIYRIAERNGEPIGYGSLGLDRSLEFDTDLRALELKQLYLRGNATGGGVGSALMEWTLGEGRARGFEAVILSVYSENHAGQRFYRRHGFEKWADTYFMVGSQRDDEYIFGRLL